MSEQEELRDDAPAQPEGDPLPMEPDAPEAPEFENEPSPHQGEEGQDPV
jgi:hypothetical protein